MKTLLDTNILIDYLKGIEGAKTEIALHDSPSISIITWIELLVGARNKQEETRLTNFLHQFNLHSLSRPIAKEAVLIRRSHKIRLPDAIIWATAKVENCLLVTRNTRDFKPGTIGIRNPVY